MENQSNRATRIIFLLILNLLAIILALNVLVIRPLIQTEPVKAAAQPFQVTEDVTGTQNEIPVGPSITPFPTETSPFPTEIPEEQTNSVDKFTDGLFLFSMKTGEKSHLYLYHPVNFSLTPLIAGPWDDETPAISPDGKQVAFSSNRNGYWDIYILDLETRQIRKVTDSPEFDSAPTWSPDGLWIAFTTYLDNNLEIAIQSTTDLQSAPIRLTQDPAADYEPAWSPAGRELAFVSTRSGEEDIWIARLDQVDNRFQNISHNPDQQEHNPAWTHDGSFLAWSSNARGASMIQIWNPEKPERPVMPVDVGNQLAWNPKSNAIAAVVYSPTDVTLTAYSLNENRLSLSPVRMAGKINGLTWLPQETARKLSDAADPTAQVAVESRSWNAGLNNGALTAGGRFSVVPLEDVSAPFSYLHDAVDESFKAMRAQVASETGWDFLASLENAYIPFNEPPSPGSEDNWLYTGRAIAVNPIAINAGWMTLAREDFAGQTFWRIYLRARYQDGSQGKPLTTTAWDMNARFLGDPKDYEQGGRAHGIPTGYWVDFTEIAQRFGWLRMPALPNWRGYLPAARFNLYLANEGLDWNSAMAEIYPPEALVTPTFRPTFTPTSTVEPVNNKGNKVSPTPLPSPTPTLRPTLTPLP